MRRAAGVTVVALLLALSPVARWLVATMPRLLLLAVPLWFVLGLAATAGGRLVWERGNPHGLTGLAWTLGAFGFWMIPRSVDAVASSALVAGLMAASLFAAGALLAASWRRVPFVIRGALGIQGAAMTIALGFIYLGYTALLCGTFNLAQQRQTGVWLLRLAPVVVLIVVGAGARALHLAARQRRRERLAAPTP